MYYALIILSVVMFGGCFALNDAYRQQQGGTLRPALQFSLISSIAGLLVILTVNGFRLEFTVFTFLLALVSSLSGFGFAFCSFKALGSINLSVFSLFSMIGGMALPFFQGILFYGEPVTVAKLVCVVFICVALLLTVERGKKAKGTIYYIGVFVLNGMSGVLSKLFTEAAYPKTSAAGYSILSGLCSVTISALLLLLFFRKPQSSRKMTLKGVAIGAANGVLNPIANLILVIALTHVDASVQYPMVTGGVMIVSTLMCFFGKNKPGKKDVLSIFLAFLGMLALFVIPV